MKTIITLAFTSFMLSGNAQDTLNCKKDLSYDKKENFYYKKGDDTKTPVSGNAICTPKKGMVNKGKLVDGKWNGLVTGYQDNRVVGKAHYKNGVKDGLMTCYTETGKTKDSVIYSDGNMAYASKTKFDKDGEKVRKTETNYGNDTEVIYEYDLVNDLSYVSEIRRYKDNKKDGAQEFMKGESDAPGSLFTYTYEEQNYENGKLKTTVYYNNGAKYQVNDYVDGKLAMQNDIDADGNVAASYPLKHGKKHGTAVIYGKKGEKPSSAEYSKGKLVTSK